MLLLNPGPVTLTERVRKSLLQTDLCHRESEFFDLQQEARERTLGIYGLDPTQWQAILMTGSGTAAVECMIAGLVPEDGALLIIENGVYGERTTQIAEQYRIPHTSIKHDWMSAPDLARVAVLLDSGRFTHVFVVHHETTTGRLNDLQGLASVCRSSGVQLLVDGVSSFAAEAFDFTDGVIAAVAVSSNKCLHSVPGVAFVVARRDVLVRATRRTYYLDIARLAKYQDERNTPFTPAVHAYYALVEALRELEDGGGWSARHAHYAALAERVRAGLAELNIDSVLPPEQSSVVLRSYRLPKGIGYQRLHDELKIRGFVIYAGQGGLSTELFRISTMGNIHVTDIDKLLAEFATLVR